MSLQDVEFIDYLVKKICEYFKKTVCHVIQKHVQHMSKTSKNDEIQKTNTSISTQIKCIQIEVQEKSFIFQISK